MTEWGSSVEREIRRRIGIAVTAYAYEIADKPICSDAIFDWLCGQIDRKMTTGHPLLDEFFLVEFSPMTGMWIHQHPELDKIRKIFEVYYDGNRAVIDDPRFRGLVRGG